MLQESTISQTFSSTCALRLSRAARSSGGDKYQAIFQECETKDRFIYVPQELSRFNKEPNKDLSLALQNFEPSEQDLTKGWFKFVCLKKAQSQGDDRYTVEYGDCAGDIYLPKEYRGSNYVWLRFNEGE